MLWLIVGLFIIFSLLVLYFTTNSQADLRKHRRDAHKTLRDKANIHEAHYYEK